MTRRVLTEVSATVPAGREPDLVAGFRELVASSRVPDGLLRTELLRGAEGSWRIQSLWRDRQALEAMRAGTDQPAAPRLFRTVGAEPTLAVLDVELATEPVRPTG